MPIGDTVEEVIAQIKKYRAELGGEQHTTAIALLILEIRYMNDLLEKIAGKVGRKKE